MHYDVVRVDAVHFLEELYTYVYIPNLIRFTLSGSFRDSLHLLITRKNRPYSKLPLASRLVEIRGEGGVFHKHNERLVKHRDRSRSLLEILYAYIYN